METICFPETMASTYESTRRDNSEQNRQLHSRETLKYHDIVKVYQLQNLVFSYMNAIEL
jgi:hypothetical protein